MSKKQGIMVISLDFEMMWGVHDTKNNDYHSNIIAVHKIVPKLLELFDKYRISCTWATVGALFANNKQDLLSLMPQKKPNYDNPKLSSYMYMDKIEEESKLHFAPNLIEQIKKTPNQEIGSHTFSHYYCCESGQTISDFEADIEAYNEINKRECLHMESLVFPRNQYTDEYLKIIAKHGFSCFRGLEQNWINRVKNKKIRRYLLFIDSYLGISGDSTYHINEIRAAGGGGIIDIKSSLFYRPYTDNKLLERLKIIQAKRKMKIAARKGKIVHIWCHPHNFGSNFEKSISQFDKLLEFYSEMNLKYGLKSLNMGELARMVTE